MTHKALIRQLQISCLGLDPIDPLRLLVDDVIEALAQEQDGECKYCTDGCPACDARKLPPQRTWVGLTDDEYFEIGQRHWLPSSKVEQIYYEIEAKLKELNT